MTIRLIINADDFGRTCGISAGVRKAHLQGVVTSSTCMMNLPTVEADLILAMKECPRLGLGVHLNLTYGKPLLGSQKLSMIVDNDGRLPGLDGLLIRLPRLKMDQVEREWRAQIERFVTVTGKYPTHLDSHHHMSFFTRELFSLMLRLAGEYGSAIRFPLRDGAIVSGIPDELMDQAVVFIPELLRNIPIRCPDSFITTFYDEGISLEEMFSILDGLTDGTFEIMTHPGIVEAGLDSSYSNQREKELVVLTDPQLRKGIEKRGIELIHFGEI
jgi:predicted glycoside hydrolase/deacetylase ChbG (UPF0249 family)